MPDSCYRRIGFFDNDSEESVYGDQGQEVAREVWQDRLNTRRQQEEVEEYEVPRSVRGRSQWREQLAQCITLTSRHVGEEECLDDEAQCGDTVFS